MENQTPQPQSNRHTFSYIASIVIALLVIIGVAFSLRYFMQHSIERETLNQIPKAEVDEKLSDKPTDKPGMYTSKVHRISIAYPERWIISNTDKSKDPYVHQIISGGNTRDGDTLGTASFSLSVESLDQDVSLAQILDTFSAHYRAMGGITGIKTSRNTIAAGDIGTVYYTIEQGGTSYSAQQSFLVKGDKLYYFTFIDTKEAFATSKKIGDDMLATLTIH